jgi:hypothetical protein
MAPERIVMSDLSVEAKELIVHFNKLVEVTKSISITNQESLRQAKNKLMEYKFWMSRAVAGSYFKYFREGVNVDD